MPFITIETQAKSSSATKTNWRWVICSMLFLATTVNYLDRQVLSLTWKDFISPTFHWTDTDYGTITGFFSLFYAFVSLFAGKFIDWMGSKKGYLIAIFIWSVAACLHAGCGWATREIVGIESEIFHNVEAGSALALSVASISVWLFLSCRALLALGEAGNFPAAIKVTAQYFPKKDRAFATAVFNSGASVGALAAPFVSLYLPRNSGGRWPLSSSGPSGLSGWGSGTTFTLHPRNPPLSAIQNLTISNRTTPKLKTRKSTLGSRGQFRFGDVLHTARHGPSLWARLLPTGCGGSCSSGPPPISLTNSDIPLIPRWDRL